MFEDRCRLQVMHVLIVCYVDSGSPCIGLLLPKPDIVAVYMDAAAQNRAALLHEGMNHARIMPASG